MVDDDRSKMGRELTAARHQQELAAYKVCEALNNDDDPADALAEFNGAKARLYQALTAAGLL